MEKRFGHSIADRAAAAAVAHVILRLVRKHPWVAADLLLAGLGRGGTVGLREIARHLRGKVQKRQAIGKKPLLLEAPERRPAQG